MSIEWLAEGNVSAAGALELVSGLTAEDRAGLSASNVSRYAVRRLEEQQILLVHTVPRNPLENNVCVEMYFQLGAYSLLSLTRLDLLEQLVSEPYFDDLRTKQQLGYSVSCGIRQTHGVLGFCFQVVSSAFSLTHVQDAILSFVTHMASHTLHSMTAEKYAENVAALISIRSEPEMSLSDAAGASWSEIDDHRLDFAIKERQVALLSGRPVDSYTSEDLQTLTQEGMERFVQEAFLAAPRMLVAHSSLDGTETSAMAERLSTTVKGFEHCTVRKANDVDDICAWLQTF
jgi:nardilysin